MGFLLLVLAAVSWGTTGTTMKLVAAGSSMSPLLVGLVRVAIAAPCLWGVARWLTGPVRLPPRKHAGPVLLAGLAMGAYQVCYFGGVARTSVAVGSLIAICSAPLLITLLAALWLGERTDALTWAALAAGVSGAALLTIGPHGAGRLPP
ncbi:MAG TPA: DMT family transporter, partial [Methylomirabilota bacterium]|nr:DMT family transporter [Methylomirabilota bacterium]